MPVEESSPHLSTPYMDLPGPTSPGIHVVARLREVTSSPSPLMQFLQDPNVLELSRSNRNSRTKSKSSHRDRRSTSIMALALVEEERQVSHLKAILRNASDRIEYEIRRADEADSRSVYAELLAKEATAKVVVAENARRGSESRAERLGAENGRLQMQIDSLERELKQAKADVQSLEARKAELEESTIKSKETSRQYKIALQEFQEQADEREETRLTEMQGCFDDGREEGWDRGYNRGFEEGQLDGYEEGRRTGRKEGIREGKEKGRIEERRNALEAFDRFLNEEMDEYDGKSQRIRKWAESIYHCNSVMGFESPHRHPSSPQARHRSPLEPQAQSIR